MNRFVVLIAGITGLALIWIGEAQAAKSTQNGDAAINKKREQCCMQFGGVWDPSVNPGYCRKLRGNNAAITFNNCANGT